MRLVPLAEARAAFLSKIEPVASTAMATAKAGGLVLGEDVIAPADVPAQPVALQRGCAVTSRVTVGASSYLPGPLPQRPALLEAGEALPAGTDAVADEEDIRESPGGAEIIAAVAPGRHTRHAGGDFAEGQVIAQAGTRLQSPQIAVLRAAGITEVQIRMPHVLIAGPQGSCASAALVMDLATQAGADVSIAYVPESRLAAALRSAAGADLVLVAGWTGPGFAAAARALGESGQVIAREIAIGPGIPTACGLIARDNQSPLPVILLPGRPEETLASWLFLTRPCVDRLAGYCASRPAAALPLARKLASAPGMVDLALLERQEQKWKPLAVGDISWIAVAQADAWLAIPAESEGYAAGEIVEAEFL